MQNIEGTVEKIIFHNKENGFTIFSLQTEAGKTLFSDTICVKGVFYDIEDEEYLKVVGEFEEDPKYGRQFKADHYELCAPSKLGALEEYLSRGLFKGIGPVLAKRIVKKFKGDSFKIMQEDPMKLCEVEGIGKRTAELIGKHVNDRTKAQNAMIFLANYGVSQGLGAKIYKKYGEKLYQVMQQNPYRIAEDLNGVGFLTADRIALKNGIPETSQYRIRSGILYLLQTNYRNGNVYCPYKNLMEDALKLLNVDEKKIEEGLFGLKSESRITLKEEKIYIRKHYIMECEVAKMLAGMVHKIKAGKIKVNDAKLDDVQKSAVKAAAENSVLVLTGGPGTGKTTTTNLIIQHFEKAGKEVLLAAPTGRAAKRMEEATGQKSRTIHRLLEVSAEGFGRNADNPLDGDVLIIDETSMVDMELFHALLRAIPPQMQLILVGDKNQLPSVGAGNILGDIIDSGVCMVIELKKIYRQAEGSDIISNAHKLLNKQPMNLSNHSTDFFYRNVSDSQEIHELMMHYITESLPAFTGESDIQVLTPTRKREFGCENLNLELQNLLNPDEKDVKGYRVNDKVIQLKNNYSKERELKNGNKIKGVFNGDAGRVQRIDENDEYMYVKFEDESVVRYDFDELDELGLAYALTIHKSQGSEYPVVVIPVWDYIPVLTTVNLLYTAITRAKKAIMLIGPYKKLQCIARNTVQAKRYTALAERLKNQR